MAETTEFDHDQLAHILADHLVEVPVFQRRYSWDLTNVQEYLEDLSRARDSDSVYFMGTLVFAKDPEGDGRRKIVDGQQRLTTTALLLIAIRDRLADLGRTDLADNVTETFLYTYSRTEEKNVLTLIVSPGDQDAYDRILAREAEKLAPNDRLRVCFDECASHLVELAPTPNDYRALIELTNQLEHRVQVLVAIATDLPEAYVIFETLNDRGAELTTVDLLKNYLFSTATASEFNYVQHAWTELESSLGQNAADLVKLVRFDYASRHGRTTVRKLYRAIQDELRANPGAKHYLQRLKNSRDTFLALREPDHPRWRGSNAEVRDALLAYRRFGFESSYPTLMAAFEEWDERKAIRLLVKLTKWNVRAHFAGRLGAGSAEEAFAAAAQAISEGSAKNQQAVRALLRRLIPTDPEFRTAFSQAGKLQVGRAKYVLAMLEKAHDAANKRPVRAFEWNSPGVTLEHVMPRSEAGDDEQLQLKVEEIGNLALLEKSLNHRLGGKPFERKKDTYKQSDYWLTKDLSEMDSWSTDNIDQRTQNLTELACRAWPAS